MRQEQLGIFADRQVRQKLRHHTVRIEIVLVHDGDDDIGGNLNGLLRMSRGLLEVIALIKTSPDGRIVVSPTTTMPCQSPEPIGTRTHA